MLTLACTARDGLAIQVTPGPDTVSGFYEGGQYSFAITLEGVHHLAIDDETLPVIREAGSQQWQWAPAFYAGIVHAELYDENNMPLAAYRFHVAPPSNKLAVACFEIMVNELIAQDPQMLFGSEVGRHAIGSEGQPGNVYLEYSRLKQFGQHFLLALKKITAHPRAVLRSERSTQPMHRVRRIDQQTLRNLVKNPAAVAALPNRHAEGAHHNATFDIPASRESLDTPAHRILLTVLESVISRMKNVRQELNRLAINASAKQARTALLPRLARRDALLAKLKEDAEKLHKTSPFSAVTRRESSGAGLTAIAGHPDYARAYRLGWQILRPGLEGLSADETLSISPTWEIYERWCFMRIVQAIKTMFPSLDWKTKILGMPDRIRVTGRAQDLLIRVQLQASFTAVDKKRARHQFHSISSSRRPDIVITSTSSASHRFIVLDAKFRTSRDNVLDAMASAHIYRDSLRWQDRQPDYALLLIPAGGAVQELERTDFQARHRVGVIPLSPASGNDRIVALLTDVLKK